MGGNCNKKDKENEEVDKKKKTEMKFEDHGSIFEDHGSIFENHGYLMLSHYGGLNVDNHKRFEQFLMVNVDLNRFRYSNYEEWLEGARNGN